jgi:hypothetical protein
MPVSSSPSRRLLVLSAVLPALLLNACGGGSSSDDDLELIRASSVIGQTDFVSGSANRGGAVSALGIAQPLGTIATDGSHFFIADYGNHRVLGYASIPTATTPALFVLGQDAATASTPGTGPTRMALPASVAISDGRLVVADAGNHRVLIWNTLPVGNTPPDVVVGQPDLLTDDPGTAADKLSFPIAATIANNRLIVSDQDNNRVLIWNTVPTANGTAADVVLGQQDFASSVANDEEDGLNSPAGIWSDGFRLLVADSGNNRVLVWSQLPRSSGADASFVIGQSDFSRVTAGVGQGALRTPFGVASDGTRIWVADSGNNRVLEFDTFPIANNALAVDVYGQDRDSYSARLPNDADQDGVTDDSPSATTLSSATGVSVFANVLYIVDRSNHRVLAFPG